MAISLACFNLKVDSANSLAPARSWPTTMLSNPIPRSFAKISIATAAMGDNVIISARGDGAEDAVAALCALIEDKFGEE